MTRKIMTSLFIWCAVALALPLVSASAYDNGATVRTLLKTTTAGNGQPVTYLKTDQPEITAAIVEIAPGAETGWHTHSIPVYAYVLEGTLAIAIDGGKTLSFKKGEVIVEVRDTPHNGKNIGQDKVRLIVFYTGAKDTPLAVPVSR